MVINLEKDRDFATTQSNSLSEEAVFNALKNIIFENEYHDHIKIYKSHHILGFWDFSIVIYARSLKILIGFIANIVRDVRCYFSTLHNYAESCPAKVPQSVSAGGGFTVRRRSQYPCPARNR